MIPAETFKHIISTRRVIERENPMAMRKERLKPTNQPELKPGVRVKHVDYGDRFGVIEDILTSASGSKSYRVHWFPYSGNAYSKTTTVSATVLEMEAAQA